MDQTATAAAVSGGDLREKIEASGLRAGVGAELGFVIAKGDKDNSDHKSKVHKLERSGSIHDLVRATEALPPGQNPVDHDDQTVDDDPSSTVLDLTNFQLHDFDSIELPSSLTELDLTTNHLTGLDPQIATLYNKKKPSNPLLPVSSATGIFTSFFIRQALGIKSTGQQPLIYSFVVCGMVILAEYKEFTGNFTIIASQYL
ncbi:hypothetical protein FF1_043741 [Malus domestica]